MGRQISRAESWSTTYKAFQNINFSAYDFNTVKRSLIDYIKLYHSENFNDYIENSEIIAQVEVFAYVAEILAYRQDMNAHENFFGLAERKDSILQLAKYISYNASRNLPARGLVKITSIQSTQKSSDSKGNSLANKKITWNDSNNIDWKEQFHIVMNLITEQRFGSVSPNDRVQVDDVLFELYRLKNQQMANGVISFTANANGESHPMELVPVSLNEGGPYERRPEKGAAFSVLYGSDGLGDSSDSTGFFCFTKQGTLNKVRKQYDGITPNQTTDIGSININETDLWINNIDPDTGLTFKTEVVDPLGRRLGASGEWVQVDIANVENVIFNTNLNRNKFEIETLDNDDVRIIYGDGEFADIPSGMFDIWYRTSTAGSSVILQNSVINKTASFTYLDDQQKVQTFTFTFSLTNSLVNGAPTEDIERIRRFAPSVFYTQDRMVNGRDYNSYPLQDQSIAKLRTVNRTFSGDSKYLSWHDPSEHYDDVKIFGDDLSIFYKTSDDSIETIGNQPLKVIRDVLQPLLSRIDIYITHTLAGLRLPNREFSQQEIGTLDINASKTLLGEMQKGLSELPGNFTLFVCYRPTYNAAGVATRYDWVTFNESNLEIEPSLADECTFTLDYDRLESKWTIRFKSSNVVAYSPTTRFWFNNGLNKTLVQDTLNPKLDNVVILGANINGSGGLLGRNQKLNVIGTTYAPWLPATGQVQENTLSVIPQDDNNDGVPDDLDLPSIMKSDTLHTTVAKPSSLATPFTFRIDLPVEHQAKPKMDDLLVTINNKRFVRAASVGEVVNASTSFYTFNEVITNGNVTALNITFQIKEFGTDSNIEENETHREYNAFIQRGTEYRIQVVKLSYAYFTRTNEHTSEWQPVTQADVAITAERWRDSNQRFMPSIGDGDGDSGDPVEVITRYVGRNALNFAWFHRTPRYHLVDPSPTNIMDMFIISRGYYDQVRRWLRGDGMQPIAPSSLELRSSYDKLLESRMISDTVIVHTGRFKILFGKEAPQHLRATFKIIKSNNGRFTDNELKVRTVDVIRNFFDIDNWEFGEAFYGTELIAAIHSSLPGEIDSIVIVPASKEHRFGELFEIIPEEDELFQPSISVSDIILVEHYNSKILKQQR